MLRSYFLRGIALLLLCLMFSGPAQAWSRYTHTALADTINGMLKKDERRYYSRLARILGKQKGVKNLTFRDMSAWVDSIKNIPLQEVFEGQVPAALASYQQYPTATWHYENHLYDPNKLAKDCRIPVKGQLEKALLAIDQALQEKRTLEQEAILVAFAMHLIEDVHQPLHTSTRVESGCKHDIGGNRYCLEKKAGRCVQTLHHLWDRGFGVSNNVKFLKQVELGKPSTLPFRNELALILAEGQMVIPDVYNTQKSRVPHQDYMKKAEMIAKERFTKAATRVTYYLKAHYKSDKK